MTTFSRDDIPDRMVFREYRKRTLTKAARIRGPFSVQTREGVITCEDGWLAIDSGGWPYPIAADEFDRIYEAAKEVSDDRPDPRSPPRCGCSYALGARRDRLLPPTGRRKRPVPRPRARTPRHRPHPRSRGATITDPENVCRQASHVMAAAEAMRRFPAASPEWREEWQRLRDAPGASPGVSRDCEP